MKTLLTITAVVEVGTAASLLVSPSWVVLVLLGSPLDSDVGPVIGRAFGAALLSLGTACWCARGDAGSRAVAGLMGAMMLYNLAIVALLCHARYALGISGVGSLPAISLHSALWIGCVAGLRRASRVASRRDENPASSATPRRG